MTVFGGVAYSLGLLCPLNGFAFPSISLFWSVYNLEWINNLRSDYPLNSASAEWSYFERRGLVQSARAPLLLKPMLLIGLCAGVSRVAARELVPITGYQFGLTAHARFRLRPKSHTKDTFRGDVFNGRYSRTRLSRKVGRPDTPQVPPLKCSVKWPAIRHEPSQSGAGIRDHYPRTAYPHGVSTSRVNLRAARSHFGSDRKESNMLQSRGAVRFEPLFTTADIGLRQDASVEHVVKAFLNIGEALASRWIEMPRGILLLQSVPDEPASGAIYLYDRERHIFYFVSFLEGRDDALTAAEFDQLVSEYDLVSRTANPGLLSAHLPKAGLA